MALAGRVCLVTGSSRGIGKGIALQLGEAGATVYITGRTLKSSDGSLGSLEDTAKEIEARGGKCIPVKCDHSNAKDVEALFERVKREQNGRIDLLVNNAYAAVQFLMENNNKKFYESPVDAWDIVNNVGLRNHYICTWHATRMMVEQNHGLIIWISSAGGLKYVFNVAYGVGKTACDRMAADCGFELKKTNITCISLWPGAVRTETIMAHIHNPDQETLGGKEFAAFLEKGETAEYAGKAVVALLKDSKVHKKTGRTLMVSDLANEYGFQDVDGRSPMSMRSLAMFLLLGNGWTQMLARFCPTWIKVPKWVMHMASYKF